MPLVRLDRYYRVSVLRKTGARRPSPGPLETPWYDSTMKKRPDWPKLPGWKTFKGLQASGGFGTPPSVLRELVEQGKKRQKQSASPPPRSPARAAAGSQRAAKRRARTAGQ